MNIKYILAFAAGAITGSAVTYKIVKDRYTQIVMEQLESASQLYSNKVEEFSEREAELTKALEDVHKDDYKNITSNLGYMDYTNTNAEEKVKDEEDDIDAPYVITPEEFGMKDDYTCIGLTYYADGVLTDDGDEPIYDADDIIGEDTLTRFDEYADDAVYVRNDKLKNDYEILRVTRSYSLLPAAESHNTED